MDLIGQEFNKWNKNMLDKTFLAYDKERINQILIGNNMDEDTIIWIAITDGNYTIKSGYHHFNSLSNTNKPDSSNYNDKKNICKNFWSIKTQPRVIIPS